MFYFVTIERYAFLLAKHEEMFTPTKSPHPCCSTIKEIPTTGLRLAEHDTARAAGIDNNEALAVLSGLDNELERYITEISGPSDVECGLTFWQNRRGQTSYPKLSHQALDLVAAPA